jgi:hypothetical protein
MSKTTVDEILIYIESQQAYLLKEESKFKDKNSKYYWSIIGKSDALEDLKEYFSDFE